MLVTETSQRLTEPVAGEDTTPLFAYSLRERLVIAGSFVAIAVIGCVYLSASAYFAVEWTTTWAIGGERGGWGTFARASIAMLALAYTFRWLLLLYFAGRFHYSRQAAVKPMVTEWPFVSVCVPGFNEAETIALTLQSCINLDYPRYEVIVIDDGSTDATFEVACRFAGEYSWGHVRVFRKVNGGKWSAHNMGFHRSRGEIVACIDADSILQPDALKVGVAHFADPTVEAVAGYSRVYNRTNLLTGMQAHEYMFWNGSIRMAQARHGLVTCVPGPIGLYRRAILEEVYLRFGILSGPQKPDVEGGPYLGDTFAEDCDLTICILQLGGNIICEPLCICDTDAPSSMYAFVNQRYRWARGTIQAVVKAFRRSRQDHRYKRPGLSAWLTLYAYDLAIFPITLLAFLVTLVLVLGGGADRPEVFWALIGLQAAMNVAVTALTITLHRERWSLLLYAPLVDLYASVLLGGALIAGCIDEVRCRKMEW